MGDDILNDLFKYFYVKSTAMLMDKIIITNSINCCKLSCFFNFDVQVINSNMVGAAYPVGALEFTPCFQCCLIFSFLCGILYFIACSFVIFLWPLYCLFFFNLQLLITLWFDLMIWFDFCHFQQYFSYIMATIFSGGRSRSTQREPPTMGKQRINFITCGCESSAPFFVIYKAGRKPTPYWW